MSAVRTINTEPQIEYAYTADLPHKGIMLGRELETTLIITDDGCGGPYIREAIVHSDDGDARLCLDGSNRNRSDADAIEWALFRLIEDDFYSNKAACDEAMDMLHAEHREAAE